MSVMIAAGVFVGAERSINAIPENYALKFNLSANNAAYINSELLNFSGNKAFSISCFFNIEGISVNQRLTIAFRGDATNIAYTFNIIYSGGSYYAEYRAYSASLATGVVKTANITSSILKGWNHIALTNSGINDASGVKIYLNAINKTTSVSQNNLSAMYTGVLPMYVGKYSTSTYSNGCIDDLAFFNKELSESEVFEVFSQKDYSNYLNLSTASNIIDKFGFDNTLKGIKNILEFTATTPLYSATTNKSYISTTGNNSTAILNSNTNKYATIEGALIALIAAKTRYNYLYLDNGDYALPSETYMISNQKYIGQSCPTVDSATNPTKLINGVVIKGGKRFINVSNILCTNIGFDAGLEWCNTVNSGTAKDGLAIGTNLANSNTCCNVVIGNCVSLCKDASVLFHSMIFEYIVNPKLTNCTTYYGTHGFVFKTIGATCVNMQSFGNNTEGLIIKQDNTLYPVKDIIINGYKYRNINNSNPLYGNIFIQNQVTPNITNVNIFNCDLDATSTLLTKTGNMSGIVVKDMQGNDIV